jgi:hypothetical protein
MKQTAVDWIIQQLYNHDGHIDVLDVASINGYFEKAKEMEKEQIIKAYDKGICEALDYGLGKEYYNETYNTETK